MFWVGTAASSAVNAWGFAQNGLESSYGCIRTVLKRLFNIWRSIFFIVARSLQNFRKSKMSSSQDDGWGLVLIDWEQYRRFRLRQSLRQRSSAIERHHYCPAGELGRGLARFGELNARFENADRRRSSDGSGSQYRVEI